MTEGTFREVYARIMRERDATGRADAVSVEQMRAVIERRGPEDERVRTLDAIMRNQDTRADFEILRAAFEAAPPRTLQSRAPYAIAAVVVVMVGGSLWLRSRTGPEDVARGSTPGVAIISPGPVATAGTPMQFSWHSVPGARQYLLQVVDRDGTVAYTTTTRDTLITAPGDVRLSPDSEYRWWVEAEQSSGSPVKSAVHILRISR